MIFDALYESAKRRELILIDGGFCRYHLRNDGQLTIYEIIATRKGAGKEMVNKLRKVQGVISILARCPEELPSNKWYERVGFSLARQEKTKSGKGLNVWILSL